MDIHINDKEWGAIEPHLSKAPPKQTRRGRPRLDDRKLFEGILWILITGSMWHELPREYPSKSSCHRRFQAWCRDGSWLRLQKALIRRLKKKLNFEEAFIDGTIVTAKKGVPRLAFTAAARA